MCFQSERNGRRSPDHRRSRPKEPPQWRLKEDDSDATRTLFVGNMPSDIREYEIRKASILGALIFLEIVMTSTFYFKRAVLGFMRTWPLFAITVAFKVFERYGKIEDIDIKTPANTDAAYAFVMFQVNLFVDVWMSFCL